MKSFLPIFVLCFVVASIQAKKVEVFGDIENKKVIGYEIISERAEPQGRVVRTTKFPKVITIVHIVFIEMFFLNKILIKIFRFVSISV